MRSNYRQLGPYIREVDVRNTAGKEENLLGVSTQKVFIVSIANTVGTDFSKYKVVKRGQFTYVPDTSRRGDKIGLAMLDHLDEGIVSSAYTVFEIINHNDLLPEYLMMWFRRPEFDRYARYMSHGSVREIFGWEEMCHVELPIPTLEKQKEIVAEYNTLVNRIKLNEELNRKLEETAQAIYKHWFVEGVDVENLPEGWMEKSFTEVVKLSGGGTPNTNIPTFWNGEIPFFTPADVSKGYYSIQTEKSITDAGLKNCNTKLYPKNTVFVTARGTVGAISIAGCEMVMNQSCYALTGKYQFFIHQLTRETMSKLKTEAVGAVFGALVTKDFDAQFVIKPPIELQKEFDNKVSKLYDYILLKTKKNQKLTELKELLLSKMIQV
ncbi:MAG: restriction endonuclease subunit S [Candidatus Moranbacteria bacterium]|nr:restriction endonuclease subunit S [Candidatus Moranbacteria bacterium]